MAWTTPDFDTEPPGPRAAHSCDFINNKLYIFGGWNGKKALNDLYTLDVETLIWSEPPVDSKTAPACRNNHTTAVVGTRLFVHGGHDGSKWLADLHILDTNSASPTTAWSKPVVSGQLPSARACHTMTRVGRKLYMFGGYDGAKCFNDVDVLDLDTMTWIQPRPQGTLPQARNAHTITVVGTKLYLFGGHSGNKHLKDLHILDTETLTWHQPDVLGVCPPGLRGHTANLIGHKIFLFGGYDGRGRSNDLYVLNTETMKWMHPTECDKTPAGRQRHTASLVGSRQLFIFGGFDGNKWLNDLHVLDVGQLEANAITDQAINSLITNMRGLLNNSEFSDVTFVVEGRPIPAHKAILAAQCAQFRAMFLNGMKESSETQITIPSWSYSSFLSMLEFLYTGSVSDFSPAVALDLLGLADHYTLDVLKNLCENTLIHNVDTDNVPILLTHAHRFQAQELKKFCLNFILKHFDVVARTKAFEDLGQIPQLLLEVTKAAATKQDR
eukprot:GILI01005726.1.p1 GENE.GILI01005726.1~~GILI01005726.1.p1  ORF type:complete len:497 (+),score=112.38 GILI01005726.1:197-1687(+)